MVTKNPGLICCFLLLLLAGTWGLAACGDQPGTLEGTAIWASDGTPLVGAEVRVFALDLVEGTSSDMPVFAQGPMLQEQPTGEDGAFSFSLEPGDYIVGVWLEGEEVASGRAEVKGGTDLGHKPQRRSSSLRASRQTKTRSAARDKPCAALLVWLRA